MPLYNMAGLDYKGPFYAGTRKEKIDRRKAVLFYIPHVFKPAVPISAGLCRICGFPFADAACAGAYND